MSIKIGRPAAGTEKETIRVIHVALDEATAAALACIEAALDYGTMQRGRTSEAVRRAILGAAERLREPSPYAEDV